MLNERRNAGAFSFVKRRSYCFLCRTILRKDGEMKPTKEQVLKAYASYPKVMDAVLSLREIDPKINYERFCGLRKEYGIPKRKYLGVGMRNDPAR